MLEKDLTPGKWRIGVHDPVTGVRLVGMRGRRHDLIAMPKEEFMSRLNRRPNGEVVEAAVLRGVPQAYYQEGPFLMLWPSPAHNWQIEVYTIPKEKKHAAAAGV
jgi:hypothetical protein